MYEVKIDEILEDGICVIIFDSYGNIDVIEVMRKIVVLDVVVDLFNLWYIFY